MNKKKIVVGTVISGNRWEYLKQVVDATLRDELVHKLIIVDNASTNKEELRRCVEENDGRVVLIEHEENLGSAGGFASALSAARQQDGDYVLLLDDDSVPEDNFGQLYLNALEYFGDQRVVISGNRHNVLGNKDFFYQRLLENDNPSRTFFNVFGWRQMLNFLSLVTLGKHYRRSSGGIFVPIIPTEGFVYGGAFIPMRAVKDAPLPDRGLFLYGDDIEYAWGIKDLGYKTYLCSRPMITDVDLTFGQNSSHIVGLYDPKTSDLKVYYRIRNMVLISRRHKEVWPPVLLLNVLMWIVGLFLVGFSRYGLKGSYYCRSWLITQAVVAGYFPDSSLAANKEKQLRS